MFIPTRSPRPCRVTRECLVESGKPEGASHLTPTPLHIGGVGSVPESRLVEERKGREDGEFGRAPGPRRRSGDSVRTPRPRGGRASPGGSVSEETRAPFLRRPRVPRARLRPPCPVAACPQSDGSGFSATMPVAPRALCFHFPFRDSVWLGLLPCTGAGLRVRRATLAPQLAQGPLVRPLGLRDEGAP